ncbi:putative RNA-directed DNA polymerase [Helianthus anomalus]
MMNFLFAKNKIEFVDGSIKKPEKTCKDYMPWMRADAMIKGWLTTAMEKNIRNSVKYASTAAEIWSDLDGRFGKESAPRAYEIKQKIAGTRQAGNSVSAYFTQLRSLWDQAQSVQPFPQCSCDKCECEVGKKIFEHQEKEHLYEFLMGLGAEFTVIRTQILATKPIPSLTAAYHMVHDDEKQRAVSNENKNNIESAAFKAFQKREGNHNKEKGGAKGPRDGNDHCSFCNRDGHKKEGCFKLVGYPDWWPGKKGEKTKGKATCVETESSPIPGLTQEHYQTLVKHFSGSGNNETTKTLANIACKINDEGEWIIDSGCTEYITYLPNILINKKAAPLEGPVLIPNGESIPVKGKGEYILPGGAKVNNVLYIPDFKCNLLLVSRLSRDLQCVVSFFPDFCVMQGLQRRNLIGAGRCEGGLYRMKMVQEKKALATAIETWHKRLGHASKGKLAKVDFLSTFAAEFGNFCDSCAMAKFARTPFPSSFIKTVEPFQLIHCDIWGGYRVPSYTKANYFLTIVDDFSRAVWVFLIKHKSDASKCLVNFCKMVEVQFEKYVKRVRCDNGGEFTSNEMINFYNEKGMLLETTCPHTPQQNGVVERKHRHLLETARALRFGAKLPKRFWGERVLTASYVINRLPSNVLKNKTPFEIILGVKPDYNHLRVFGCLVYFKNFNTKGDKFEQRGKPGVFLGYPPGTKGYKILDLETRKIIASRDVLFHEENFPFANIGKEGPNDNEKPIKLHDCFCEKEAEQVPDHPNDQDTDSGSNVEAIPIGPEPNDLIDGEDGSNFNEVNDDGIGLDLNVEMGQENEGDVNSGQNVEEQIEVERQDPIEPRPTRTKSQPSKFKDFVIKVPPFGPTPNIQSSLLSGTLPYLKFHFL